MQRPTPSPLQLELRNKFLGCSTLNRLDPAQCSTQLTHFGAFALNCHFPVTRRSQSNLPGMGPNCSTAVERSLTDVFWRFIWIFSAQICANGCGAHSHIISQAEAGVSGNSRFPWFPGIQASNFPSHGSFKFPFPFPGKGSFDRDLRRKYYHYLQFCGWLVKAWK